MFTIRSENKEQMNKESGNDREIDDKTDQLAIYRNKIWRFIFTVRLVLKSGY